MYLYMYLSTYIYLYIAAASLLSHHFPNAVCDAMSLRILHYALHVTYVLIVSVLAERFSS